jgi:hypothetical protein
MNALRPSPSPAAKPPQALVLALGHAGLLPFVLLALLCWLVNEQALPYVAQALVAYGALIAAFLGGLHWGVAWLALQAAQGTPAAVEAAHIRRHLGWGIAPALLAWPAVLMPAHAALPWLGALLLVAYAVDRRLLPSAGLGHWLTLRFRLSAVAAGCCFVAAGAV